MIIYKTENGYALNKEGLTGEITELEVKEGMELTKAYFKTDTEDINLVLEVKVTLEKDNTDKLLFLGFIGEDALLVANKVLEKRDVKLVTLDK